MSIFLPASIRLKVAVRDAFQCGVTLTLVLVNIRKIDRQRQLYRLRCPISRRAEKKRGRSPISFTYRSSQMQSFGLMDACAAGSFSRRRALRRRARNAARTRRNAGAAVFLGRWDAGAIAAR
jgi:hypothetical protein